MLQGLLLIALLKFAPHGDLEVRIAEKTAEIRTDPKNLLLYMQRGELHAQHDHPDSALIDYEFAIGNGIDSSTVFVLMAEAQLALGKLDDGQNSVKLFLKHEPDHLKGIHVRAQLYEAQGQFENAISDFELVLKKAESARPHDYVKLSELYLKRDSTDHNNAIDVLHRGIAKLGNIISLQMKMYELEKQRGNYLAAHQLLDDIMKPLSRKERLLVEKAELFQMEGKTVEAAESLVNAENAIASLPLRFQNIGSTQKLQERIAELKKNL